MVTPKGFPARSMSSVPTRGFPTQPFPPRAAMPSGAGDPTQEAASPVPTMRQDLGPTRATSPMAGKVRAALMMKLRGGK